MTDHVKLTTPLLLSLWSSLRTEGSGWTPAATVCVWSCGNKCRLVQSIWSWLKISSSWLMFRQSWGLSRHSERGMERNEAVTLESVIAPVSCAIKSQFSPKSHGLKLAASKDSPTQVFIIFFHSLHKPASLVYTHTQHQGRAGPWWRLIGSVQATLTANQVRFPGTEGYTSLWA